MADRRFFMSFSHLFYNFVGLCFSKQAVDFDVVIV